ncbi:hypothetical protein DSUL_140003 [Desulfovibrionales bacterium]
MNHLTTVNAKASSVANGLRYHLLFRFTIDLSALHITAIMFRTNLLLSYAIKKLFF